MSCAVLEVQFDPVTYNVIEGATVSLSAVLNIIADRDVTVDLIVIPGTAG